MEFQVYENGSFAGLFEDQSRKAVMAEVLKGLRDFNSHSYEDGDLVEIEVRKGLHDPDPEVAAIVCRRL